MDFGGVLFLSGSPGGGPTTLCGRPPRLSPRLRGAAGWFFSRHVKLPVRPLVAASMEMLWAGVLFGVLSAATGELGRVHWQGLSSSSWLPPVLPLLFRRSGGVYGLRPLLRPPPLLPGVAGALGNP